MPFVSSCPAPLMAPRPSATTRTLATLRRHLALVSAAAVSVRAALCEQGVGCRERCSCAGGAAAATFDLLYLARGREGTHALSDMNTQREQAARRPSQQQFLAAAEPRWGRAFDNFPSVASPDVSALHVLMMPAQRATHVHNMRRPTCAHPLATLF